MKSGFQGSEFGHNRLLELLFALAARLTAPFTRRQPVAESIRRILILQLQQLGDTMVFTPALAAIRKHFPAARIDVLCGRVSGELYKKSKEVDRLLFAPWASRFWQNPRKSVQGILRLRREQYDLVITDVNHVSARYSLIAFLSGARARVGFDVANRGFLLTHALERPAGRDFVSCNLLLARALGAEVGSESLVAYFDQEDSSHVDAALRLVPRNRRLIAMHVASNWQSKTWFADRWIRLVSALAREQSATIVFVGTRAEQQVIEQVRAGITIPTISLAGETNLSQLAALLARCDLFIGTDSGPRHVAAGVGCPRVILMSAQDRPERWQFNDPSELVLRTNPPCSPCLQSYCSHRQCMADISEEAVLHAASRLLSQEAPSESRTSEQRGTQVTRPVARTQRV